jgi:hypothetical protein
VTFFEQASSVIPALRYRWAIYEVNEVVPPDRLFSVAVIGPARTRALAAGTGTEWGIAAAPWTPRTAEQAKQACVEMFRVVQGDLGPDPRSYVLYEPGRTPLPAMQRENRALLLGKVRGASRVRANPAAARWETRVWILAVANNVSAYRVRCNFPLRSPGAPHMYSLTALDSVIGPRNPLAI